MMFYISVFVLYIRRGFRICFGCKIDDLSLSLVFIGFGGGDKLDVKGGKFQVNNIVKFQEGSCRHCPITEMLKIRL